MSRSRSPSRSRSRSRDRRRARNRQHSRDKRQKRSKSWSPARPPVLPRQQPDAFQAFLPVFCYGVYWGFCSMFGLVEREDSLVIPAQYLLHDYIDVLNNILSNKYGGKVLLGEGLCVGIYDIVGMGDSYVFPGKGEPTVKVQFRIVVFRPFIGEVVLGTIKSLDERGLVVSLGFTDDVMIPGSFMREPSEFQAADDDSEHPRACWIWIYEYENEEGNSAEVKFFADVGDSVRFRVHAVNFHQENGPTPKAVAKAHAFEQDKAMWVVGTLNEEGLGPPKWWT